MQPLSPPPPPKKKPNNNNNKQTKKIYKGFVTLSRLVCFSFPYVVHHHKSHIMSEKQYFSFWQIWILQILCFKSIYNLPITFPLPPPPKKKKEMMESLKFSFPSVFLASWAINMISDFIRVTWWRTTYRWVLPFNPLKTSPGYTRAGVYGNACLRKIKSSSTG